MNLNSNRYLFNQTPACENCVHYIIKITEEREECILSPRRDPSGVKRNCHFQTQSVRSHTNLVSFSCNKSGNAYRSRLDKHRKLFNNVCKQ